MDMYNTSAVPNICCCLSDLLWWSSFMSCQRAFFKKSASKVLSVFQFSRTHRVKFPGEKKKVSLLFIYASDQSLLSQPGSWRGSNAQGVFGGPSAPGAQRPPPALRRLCRAVPLRRGIPVLHGAGAGVRQTGGTRSRVCHGRPGAGGAQRKENRGGKSPSHRESALPASARSSLAMWRAL